MSEGLSLEADTAVRVALKNLHGGKIRLPRRREDRPDRDRLAQRFEQFKAAA